jgi:hypothetical protein
MEKGLDKQYNIVISMIKEKGIKYSKKHGQHIILQGKDKFLGLDTWNGYINLIDGIFDGEYYSSTFDKGEQLARDINGIETTKEKIGRAYQFALSI